MSLRALQMMLSQHTVKACTAIAGNMDSEHEADCNNTPQDYCLIVEASY